MLNPPTFAVPVSVPENGLFQGRRWTLHPDRLTRESRDFLWGYNADHHVMLADVRLVYQYRRARPIYLWWILISLPVFLIAWAISTDRGNEFPALVAASLGLGIVIASVVMGFVPRPHITVQTSRESLVLRMDSPWWSSYRRRIFFNGLAQILGIPDLIAGGGVPRPSVPAQVPVPGAIPSAQAPVWTPPPQPQAAPEPPPSAPILAEAPPPVPARPPPAPPEPPPGPLPG